MSNQPKQQNTLAAHQLISLHMPHQTNACQLQCYYMTNCFYSWVTGHTKLKQQNMPANDQLISFHIVHQINPKIQFKLSTTLILASYKFYQTNPYQL